MNSWMEEPPTPPTPQHAHHHLTHHLHRLSVSNTAFDDLAYPISDTSEAPSPRRAWIHKIHQFLDVPQSSNVAFWYAVIMLLIILASTAAFLVSSLPKYYSKGVFTTLQLVAGSIFTLDYLLRLLTSDYWYKWMMRPLSVVDLFVVVPFIVSLVPSITVNQQFIALRAVRLLYILKIIKITSYVRMTRVVARTLKKSKDGFVVLLVGVIVMCLFYSTLIFIAENTKAHFNDTAKAWIRDDGTKGDFQSIFDGIWWCLVTFTTVGYGDMFPVTTFGRVVGVFTMFTGVLLTALPVAIFTANFTELWKERKYQRRADYIKKLADEQINEPGRRPLTQKKKTEELIELLRAIEREDRQIAAAIQSARESVEEANNSHKQMQLLLAQFKLRMDTASVPGNGDDEEQSDTTQTEVREPDRPIEQMQVGEPE